MCVWCGPPCPLVLPPQSVSTVYSLQSTVYSTVQTHTRFGYVRDDDIVQGTHIPSPPIPSHPTYWWAYWWAYRTLYGGTVTHHVSHQTWDEATSKSSPSICGQIIVRIPDNVENQTTCVVLFHVSTGATLQRANLTHKQTPFPQELSPSALSTDLLRYLQYSMAYSPACLGAQGSPGTAPYRTVLYRALPYCTYCTAHSLSTRRIASVKLASSCKPPHIWAQDHFPFQVPPPRSPRAGETQHQPLC